MQLSYKTLQVASYANRFTNNPLYTAAWKLNPLYSTQVNKLASSDTSNSSSNKLTARLSRLLPPKLTKAIITFIKYVVIPILVNVISQYLISK